jgi:hypothetical protein
LLCVVLPPRRTPRLRSPCTVGRSPPASPSE